MPDPQADKIINYRTTLVKKLQKQSQKQFKQVIAIPYVKISFEYSPLPRKQALTIMLFVLPNPYSIQLILVYLRLKKFNQCLAMELTGLSSYIIDFVLIASPNLYSYFHQGGF
jgi:hypothetical protein